MADPTAMPADAMGADEGSDMGAGATEVRTYEITEMSDGTFQVECETAGQEGMEESGGGEEAGAGPQTADSWSSAMEMLNALHEQDAGSDGESKKAGFDSVFGPGAKAVA